MHRSVDYQSRKMQEEGCSKLAVAWRKRTELSNASGVRETTGHALVMQGHRPANYGRAPRKSLWLVFSANPNDRELRQRTEREDDEE